MRTIEDCFYEDNLQIAIEKIDELRRGYNVDVFYVIDMETDEMKYSNYNEEKEQDRYVWGKI